MARDTFTVDTPDLVDAVKKANSIAPTRGSEFDRAAGIRFEVQPPHLLVKATNLETSVRCQLRLTDHGEQLPEPFRLPSAIVTAYITNLPTAGDSTTTITHSPADSRVIIESGDCRARFTTIAGDSFPSIDAFDMSKLRRVDDLAVRLKRVSYATGDTVPLDGVHITGSQLVGCDRGRIALIDCAVPVEEPITAPLAGVTSALSGHNGAVDIAVIDRKLLLVPDPDTQFASTLYADDSYPKIDGVIALADGNTSTTVERAPLVEALARINALCAGERYPKMSIEAFGDEMSLEANITEIGRVEEPLAFTSGMGDADITISVDPARLNEVIGATASTVIEITWPVGRPNKPLKINDERIGYSAVVMPVADAASSRVAA